MAERLASEVIKQFPQSQFMYWAYSHVFMKKKEYKKAIQAYQKLLDLIELDPNLNPNHKITCLARLMDMYARSGNCKKAILINKQLASPENYSNREVVSLIEEVAEKCTEAYQ